MGVGIGRCWVGREVPVGAGMAGWCVVAIALLAVLLLLVVGMALRSASWLRDESDGDYAGDRAYLGGAATSMAYLQVWSIPDFQVVRIVHVPFFDDVAQYHGQSH